MFEANQIPFEFFLNNQLFSDGNKHFRNITSSNAFQREHEQGP